MSLFNFPTYLPARLPTCPPLLSELISQPAMAFVLSVAATSVGSKSAFTPTNVAASSAHPRATRASPARPTAITMVGYSPAVDEYFATSARRSYINKACPTGEISIQCIEGNTKDAPFEARTLIRQSQLRFRQLPVSVQIHNMYENRRAAITACHGCSHEESQVVANPRLAASVLLGQAEAERACNRYIVSSGPAENMMVRAVENQYMAAVNGSGVFSSACTDGQAKYEAYLAHCGAGGRKVCRAQARHYSEPHLHV
jgi:hypothetical protein